MENEMETTIIGIHGVTLDYIGIMKKWKLHMIQSENRQCVLAIKKVYGSGHFQQSYLTNHAVQHQNRALPQHPQRDANTPV